MPIPAIILPEQIERVRTLAHQLWEEEGRPDGRADAHWLKAEEIVSAEVTKPVKKKTNARPRARKF